MDEVNRDLTIIRHILTYCMEIEETVERFGNDFDVFSTDRVYRNAATMCILQIGELAGHLSEGFKAAHSAIPWRSIKAMRNVAAHEYGSISIPDVWATIANDIPDLKTYCQRILGS